MSQAFYSEAQIWPWVCGDEFVMFAMNWTDKPDWVCHRTHAECLREEPHPMAECGRFCDAAEKV
jgi:hypothetical protein